MSQQSQVGVGKAWRISGEPLSSVCLECPKKLCLRLVKDFYSDGVHKLADESGQNKQEKKKIKIKISRLPPKDAAWGESSHQII